MHDYAPNHSYPSSNETGLEPTLLGEGAQFRVYTDGPGRVRKIPQDASVTYARVASWYPGGESEQTRHEAEEIITSRHDSIAKVKEIINVFPETGHIFGNPSFAEDGSFTQDVVVPLGDVIKRVSPTVQRQLITQYIEITYRMLTLGCAPKVFNILDNTGIDKNGKLVLIDFGELDLEKEQARSTTEAKSWHQAYDVNHVMDPETKEYFLAMMDQLMQPYIVDALWKSGTFAAG